MKIAIDIDKTIFNCNSFLYKLINTYLINQDLEKELKYKIIDLDEYTLHINKVIKYLSKMHNPRFYNIEENASKYITDWINQGDEIILLSSRPSSKSLVGSLLISLKENKVPFTKLVVSCNNKAVYCKKDGIDILIDDSHYICNNANNLGIDTIWYIAKYNDNPGKKPPVECLQIATSWEELNNVISKKRTSKYSKNR